MTPPLETHGLGKRFRRCWALRDCTLTIPERAIVGLAGPNGAGKSTLLGSDGRAARADGGPDRRARTRPAARPRPCSREIGYVARDAPLYRSFTVRDTIEFARATNPRLGRVDREGVPRRGCPPTAASRRCRQASAHDSRSRWRSGSGRPLLLLDEPFARLDPLAAREFLQLLMDGVSETRRDGRDRVARGRRHRARLRPHRAPERRARPARGQRRGAARRRTGC